MAPPKKNAFMMFVNEWRQKNVEGRHMNISQAVDHCGKLWKNMDESKRGPYKSACKDANIAGRYKNIQLNTLGDPIPEVEKEENEKIKQQLTMKSHIDRIIVKAKSEHNLENTTFLFVAFNYFSKVQPNAVYVPAEFAACQYSLKHGKTSIYSSCINPESVVFGQGCETRQHADSTHQLPLPPKALGESNMTRLYHNIVEYLRGHQDIQQRDGPLVVFTATELMPVVKGCLTYIRSYDPIPVDDLVDDIKVYDIQYLFYVLKKEVMDLADLPHNNINKSVSDNVFIGDFFEYQPGISCEFHEENDRGKYCTQSKVTRWCYMFSDFMCGDLAIKPLPGFHMPPKTECRFTVSSPPSNRNTSILSNEHLVKQENRNQDAPTDFTNQNLPNLKAIKQEKYVPTDHTAFSANADDFPALGNPKKTKTICPQVTNNSNHRGERNNWNVPANSKKMAKKDDFNMFH